MHKPIFILVNADGDINETQAHEIAESFINEHLIGRSFDWHQGLKESQRWPDYEEFDTPKDASTKNSMQLITHMIKSAQNEILNFIELGQKELDQNGLSDLGNAAGYFSLAGGKTVGHIFDSTNWSCGSAIVDHASLKGFWETNEKSKIFLCGFDIHY